MKSIVIIMAVILLNQCQSDKSNKIDLEHTPEKAEIFAEGYISTSMYERDIAISPKGDEIIFTMSDYGQSKRCLVRIERKGNKWITKEILSFSGQYSDIEPSYSADGNKLYFASDRPLETDSARNDYNIWVSKRNNNKWSDPVPLPSAINSVRNEFYPSIARNGNLYFTTVRDNGIGSEDIFVSRYVDGLYSDPEPLDTNINTSLYEFNACITPDENLIIFSSFGRKDDIGGGDLYYSKRDESGNWEPSINMGEKVNSEFLDYCPFIDVSRGNFYFTSERMIPLDRKLETISELEGLANGILNGMGNIYRVHFDTIDLK